MVATTPMIVTTIYNSMSVNPRASHIAPRSESRSPFPRPDISPPFSDRACATLQAHPSHSLFEVARKSMLCGVEGAGCRGSRPRRL